MPENPYQPPKGKSAAAPIIVAVIMLLLVMLGAYLGAYLGMGETSVWSISPSSVGQLAAIDREYSREWIATAFTPAAWVESKVRGMEVKAIKKQSLSDFVHKAFPEGFPDAPHSRRNR